MAATSMQHLLPVLLWLAVLIIDVTSSSSATVVVPNASRPPIRVQQGKSVALTAAHLLIRRQPSGSGSLCRVEVDSSDPLTQTVGQMKPKVFDCFFTEGSVFYEHEGSPLRSHDSVRLLVYSFQPGNRSEIAPIRLAVEVQLRSRRGSGQGAVGERSSSTATYIVMPGPRPLTVPRFRGTSAPIDSNALNFVYDPLTTRCTVVYSDSVQASSSLAFRDWPMVGRLVDDQSTRVREFKHDCRQFLLAGYRYEHQRPPNPDMDYIPLSVYLLRLDFNGSVDATSDAIVTEKYYLPVHIDKAQKSAPPQLQLRQRSVSLAHTGGLPVVLPADLLLLPSASASSTTSDSAPSTETDIRRSGDSSGGITSGLVVMVTQIEPVLPFNINASFVDTREPTAGQISGFQPRDLREGRVAFQFATPTDTDRVELRIRLRPIDAFFQDGPDVLLNLASTPNRQLQLFPRPLLAYTQATVRFNSRNLLCSGSDCNLVSYRIRREPYSGRILMNNAPIEFFGPRTLNNPEEFSITYTHNGNIPSEDSIELRTQVSESSGTPIVFKFPIHVTRLWDSVSTLKSSNVNYRLGPGGQVCFGVEIIDESVLRTLKHDCIDMRYEVVKRPEYGNLIRALNPLSDWARSRSTSTFLTFAVSDLLQGKTICYLQQRNLEPGQTNVWDSMTLKQAGRPDFTPLLIRLRLHDKPRAPLINRSARYLSAPTMLETDNNFVITRDFLRYETEGLSPNQIVYEVLLHPYYAGTNISIDAGRLLDKRKLERIFTTGDNVKAKVRITSFKEVGCLSQFTQEDVDNGNVLYVPPLNDVGISNRTVNVYLQPYDTTWNKASPHKLTFIVLPVDNQEPKLEPQKLSVERGKRLTIKLNHLRPRDIDTKVDQLTLRLLKEPKHGKLYDGDVSIGVGQWFKVGRVRSEKISYQHDGTTSSADYFVLQVTDNNQNSPDYNIYLNITERQAWDYGTKFYANNTIFVLEGGQTVLTTEMFPTLKSETIDPRQISYLQGERPVKGEFELLGSSSRSISQFNHEDLRAGRIVYRHTTGEIGPRAIVDICPMFVYSGSDWQTHRLTFSIQPVDNQPPSITDGAQVLVKEGDSTVLSGNVIKVRDADTEADKLLLMVQDAPKHGEIRLINGSGATVNQFSQQQLLAGEVAFLQNKNFGTEFTRDNFTVIASDGERRSSPVTVQVYIYPVTDELPSIVGLADFAISKGESRVLNATYFSVTDADVPEEEVIVRIRRLPSVGTLFQDWFTARISKKVTETSNRQFTKRNLNYMRLVYHQDLDVTSLNDSFVVEASDPVYRISKTCRIAIATRNEQPPVFSSPRSQLQLYYGEKVQLTENHLLVRDPDTPKEAISISVVSLPANCELLRLEPSRSSVILSGRSRDRLVALRLGESFSQRDVQQSRMFVRASRLSSSSAASPATVELRLMAGDGRFSTDAANLMLRLVPKPAEVLELFLIRTSRLKAVTQRVTKLTQEEISVYYRDRVQNSASFQVIPQQVSDSQPCYSFELEGDPVVTDNETVFLMSDVLDGRVLFNATNCSKSKEDILFEVRSNWIGKSASGMLPVDLIRLDVAPPTLDHVGTLSLRAHEAVAIDQTVLRTSDADTPPQEILYRIKNAPKQGLLVIGNSQLGQEDSFTQADVNNGTVLWYRSLIEPPTGLDKLKFTVEDMNKTRGFCYKSAIPRSSPVTLSIRVAPSTRNPIELVRVKSPSELMSFGTGGRFGFRIKNDSLLAKPAMVLFELASQPGLGILKLGESEIPVGGSFTQRDVNTGRVTYWFNQPQVTSAVKAPDNTSDSFEFIVRTQDRRFSSERSRFRMEWSVIFFRQTRYWVRCPRPGTLLVDVTRTGAMDQMAFARFELDGSAQERRDFTVSSARTLNFNPGDRTAQIRLEISERNDSSDLRLRIDLIAPGNALIGANSRATILLQPDPAVDCTADSAHFTPSSGGDLALFRYYLRHYMMRNRQFSDQAPSDPNQGQKDPNQGRNGLNLNKPAVSSSSVQKSKFNDKSSDNDHKNNKKQFDNADKNRQKYSHNEKYYNKPYEEKVAIHVPSSEALRKLQREEMQHANKDGFPRCTIYLSGEQRSNGDGVRYICNGGRWVTLASVVQSQRQPHRGFGSATDRQSQTPAAEDKTMINCP
uniref:Cadherin domain-containing protein n=1 Tax=Macrostomum lignano TaxID=282301 RepID=A0A1I8J1K4_9PLAT